MERVLDAREFEVDGWMGDYIWSTVGFATWHCEAPVGRMHVELNRAAEADGRPYVRCTLRAELEGCDPIASGATGPDVFEAVREAADLLELALHHPGPAAAAGRGRLAA